MCCVPSQITDHEMKTYLATQPCDWVETGGGPAWLRHVGGAEHDIHDAYDLMADYMAKEQARPGVEARARAEMTLAQHRDKLREKRASLGALRARLDDLVPPMAAPDGNDVRSGVRFSRVPVPRDVRAAAKVVRGTTQKLTRKLKNQRARHAKRARGSETRTRHEARRSERTLREAKRAKRDDKYEARRAKNANMWVKGKGNMWEKGCAVGCAGCAEEQARFLLQQ